MFYPVVTHKLPHFFPEYESQRVQICYGPFKIPGSSQDNGMKNFKTQNARAPCEDCLIIWMQAGLEYLDGTDASVEDGMWLHHTVLYNEARTALQNCDKSNRRQRFFASGNERTAVDLSSNGYVMAPFFRFLKPPAKRR